MIKDILRVLKSVREYKFFAIITPLFMVAEAFLECVTPFLMSQLLSYIENPMPEEPSWLLSLVFSMFKIEPAMEINWVVIWFFIILMILGALLSLASGILGGVTAAKASTGLAKNLRLDLYKKVQSFSFANIDKFSASSLVTRMTTDIMQVSMAFQMSLRMVIRAPLMMIFSIVMAFITGGQMAWIFVALVPVVLGGMLLILFRAFPTFRRIFKKYDKMNESVGENIAGIRVVKSYVREEFEKAKFKKASDEIQNEFIKAERIVAWSNPMLNFSIHLSNMLICAIGSAIIINAIGADKVPLSVSSLSALQTYGVQILMSMMFLAMIFIMLAMGIEASKRISEVLVEEPTIKNPENPIMEVKDGSVVFSNVNFKYSAQADRNALEDLNFEIKSGSFVGILGSTGSGKTSLVNLISRLYDVTEGEIIVGGRNVKDYDLITLRDSVAVVLQKNVLFSGTIAENLRWGDENATDEDLVKYCKIAQADEFIQTFKDKYNSHIEQGGTNVSGGQKQRLCIARALLKKPKILILDDSTSAVDTKTDKLIRQALKNDIPDTTKIVIAQRISSIEDADMIIIMNNGKIDAIGNHESLLKSNEIYRDIYSTQTKKGGN